MLKSEPMAEIKRKMGPMTMPPAAIAYGSDSMPPPVIVQTKLKTAEVDLPVRIGLSYAVPKYSSESGPSSLALYTLDRGDTCGGKSLFPPNCAAWPILPSEQQRAPARARAGGGGGGGRRRRAGSQWRVTVSLLRRYRGTTKLNHGPNWSMAKRRSVQARSSTEARSQARASTEAWIASLPADGTVAYRLRWNRCDPMTPTVHCRTLRCNRRHHLATRQSVRFRDCPGLS
jgi:hypothetical protein